jgi:hypothetical protein
VIVGGGSVECFTPPSSQWEIEIYRSGAVRSGIVGGCDSMAASASLDADLAARLARAIDATDFDAIKRRPLVTPLDRTCRESPDDISNWWYQFYPPSAPIVGMEACHYGVDTSKEEPFKTLKEAVRRYYTY